MSTTAAPKIHRGAKVMETGDIKIKQKDTIVMPGLGEELVRDVKSESVDQPDLRFTQVEHLSFMEEPVRILIHRGQDKSASKVTDYIAVNGVAAEILFKNGFVQIGYLPKGVAFTTKRKYVAVIASSKIESISADFIERDGEDPTNYVQRTITAPLPFVVIEDKNPRGSEWLEGIGRASGVL